MKALDQRLVNSFQLLAVIDDRRREADNPTIGAGVERFLIQRELAELEQEISSDPGALGAFAVASDQPVRRRYRITF